MYSPMERTTRTARWSLAAIATGILLACALPSVARAQFSPPSGSTLQFVIGVDSTQTITGFECGAGQAWQLLTVLPAGLVFVDTATSTPDITGTPTGPTGSTVVSLLHLCAVPPFTLPASYTIQVDEPGEATAASKGLEKCQATVQKETAKYAAKLQRAIGACLQSIAKVVVAGNQLIIDAAGAAPACLSTFYAIGRTDGKSIADKMAAKINKACNPGDSSFKGAHTLDDVLGTGSPGVNRPLDAAAIDGYCGNFAVGSSTMSEWIACLQAAAQCGVRQQIAVAFPRALEWLNAMAAELAVVASGKAADALAALQATETAIDGTPADDSPSLACGP